MIRFFTLAVLCSFAANAWAARGFVVLVPNGEDGPSNRSAVARALDEHGLELERLVTPRSLAALVQVVSIREGLVDLACLERVSLDEWRGGLDRAKMEVQTFRPARALSLIEGLEDELVCLDGVPERKAFQELIVNRSISLSMLGRDEMLLRESMEQIHAWVGDLAPPVGLPPDLQLYLQESEVRQGVRVSASGPVGELFLDGERLAAGAVRRGTGLHFLQLVDPGTGRVSSAQMVELEEGIALIWAGRLGELPFSAEARGAIEKGRPSKLLKDVSGILRSPLVLADFSERLPRLFHVDGRQLDEAQTTVVESVPSSQDVAFQSSPVLPDASSSDSKLSLGVGLGAGALRASRDWYGQGGAGIWVRGGVSDVLSWVGGIDFRVQPELLSPSEDDFFDLNAGLPVRFGVAFAKPASGALSQGELAVHALYEVAGDSDRSALGFGAALGIFVPLWESSGARLRWQVDASSDWWSSSILVGTEWSLGRRR